MSPFLLTTSAVTSLMPEGAPSRFPDRARSTTTARGSRFASPTALVSSIGSEDPGFRSSDTLTDGVVSTGRPDVPTGESGGFDRARTTPSAHKPPAIINPTRRRPANLPSPLCRQFSHHDDCGPIEPLRPWSDVFWTPSSRIFGDECRAWSNDNTTGAVPIADSFCERTDCRGLCTTAFLVVSYVVSQARPLLWANPNRRHCPQLPGLRLKA